MENKLARLMRNTGPARILVPFGFFMIIFGILMLNFSSGDLVETTGKVTAVEESVDLEKKTVYDVIFSYMVDSRQYEGRFAEMPDAPKIGEEIKVFYDAENPETITNSKLGGVFAPILIVLGAAAAVGGVLMTVKAFRKSRELDETVPKAAPVEFEGFKAAPGVTEYYCRHDGKALKPGYILEDASRRVLFECKMTKQALVGARTFEFINHANGHSEEHEVGHTMTQSYNDEFFSVSSWFKFDGKNIWDFLHERGLRMTTNMRSKFPNLIYEVSRNGEAFARIETCGKYVHEDEAAEHKVNIPVGRYYYRIWTNSNDFETLFLTIFAISETEQAVVE